MTIEEKWAALVAPHWAVQCEEMTWCEHRKDAARELAVAVLEEVLAPMKCECCQSFIEPQTRAAILRARIENLGVDTAPSSA